MDQHQTPKPTIHVGDVYRFEYKNAHSETGWHENLSCIAAIVSVDDEGINVVRHPAIHPRTGQLNAGNIGWNQFIGAYPCDIPDELRTALAEVAISIHKKESYAEKAKNRLMRMEQTIERAASAAAAIDFAPLDPADHE